MMRQDHGRRHTGWAALHYGRLDAGLTIGELAGLVNRSHEHIRQVELGFAGVSDELLIRLASVLGMRPSELERTRPIVPPRGSNPRRYTHRAAEAATTCEQVAS